MAEIVVQLVRYSDNNPDENPIIVKRYNKMSETEITEEELDQIIKELENAKHEDMEYVGDENMDDEDVEDIDPEDIEVEDDKDDDEESKYL